MRIVNSLYPYPVLSSNDDDFNENSLFDVEYSLNEATVFRKPKLKATFNLVDESIAKLIEDGKANYFLHVECSHTSYREIFEVIKSDSEFELEIDLEKMRTNLEVTAFILAKTKIKGYSNPNVNQALYGDSYVFPTLGPGDPLAVSFTVDIELDEVNDLVKIPSIIKVAKTTEEMMRVDYDGNVLFVYLPISQYDNYVNFQGRFGETLILSIIQPALIYVLDAIAYNRGEDFQDRKWFRVLEKKIEGLGYTMNQLCNDEINSIILTQKILAHPLDRLFVELEGLVEYGDEN